MLNPLHQLHLEEQLAEVVDAYCRGQTPPLEMDVDEWADRYRFLNEVSGEKWRTEKVEVARGPMKAATEPGVRTITLMSATQLMKALDVETPIPTHNGFKKMLDIEIGDSVFDENGNSCFVIGVSEIKQADKCFELTFSDWSKIIADAGHRWLVDDVSEKKSHILTTLEMSCNFKNNNYHVPPVGPIKNRANIGRRAIINIKEVPSRLVKCIAVDSPSHLYLAGLSFIPTHNTEFVLNTVGKFMHLNPCPILVVQPKEEMAKKFSEVRLKKMLKATPVLRGLVNESERRESSNTVSFKEFPGGYITIVGATAPANLAMLPIRLVFCDEIDKFVESSGSEGDPIQLAEERTATYSTNSLCVRACSPTTEGHSRIAKSYESSDKRKPFVCCPHCNEPQIMMWSSVKWNRDAKGNHSPDTAQYACIHCGSLWTELDRHRALKTVQWRQTADFACEFCGHENFPSKWPDKETHRWRQESYVYRAICDGCGKGKCPNRHAGFWASQLYSPFRPLSEMVVKWINAQGNIEMLKAFINTQLAETFQEAGDNITNIDGLLARREKYPELPYQVGIITAGIDVQHNRVECEVIGWGIDEESWSLDHFVIPGDPSQIDIWMRLEQRLEKAYRRDDGKVSYIMAACIDLGGGHTQEVANFCRDKMERRIWPIRGVASTGRAYPVWPRKPGRTDKIQIPFYNVGVDAGKNVIYSRLLIQNPGPGYCHFPLGREVDWFNQLTAERRVKRYRGTQAYYVWENPKRARNEALDLRNYGYAALEGLKAEGLQLNIVTTEESYIMEPSFEEERVRHLESINKPEIITPETNERRITRTVVRNRSSYMNR